MSTPLPEQRGPFAAEVDAAEDAAINEEARRHLVLRQRAKEVDRRVRQAELAADGWTPSWGQVDHDAAFEAARDPKEPEVGRFVQTATEPPHGVLYTYCVNEIHGESESGKSWLALYLAAHEIKAGRGVIYVDYEDTGGSVYRRLMLLGCTEQKIREYLRYHNPMGPLTEDEEAAFARSVDQGGTLAVFDGVTEGMSLEGLNPLDAADVAAWHALTTKALAAAGWCVLAVDHTPHEGSRSFGSQHKKSAITGVSYLVEAVQPVEPGRRAVLRLRVEKDRHGSIRREAAQGRRPQWRGDLVIDFTLSSTQPEATLFPATAKDDQDGDGEPDETLCREVLRAVEQTPGIGVTALRGAIKGDNSRIDWAREWLVSRRHLTADKSGRKEAHHIGPVLFEIDQ